MAIRVKDGCVQMNVPKRIPAIDVQLLLEKKRLWIEQALNKQLIARQLTSKKLEAGELLLFQGKRYPLRLESQTDRDIYISDDNHFIISYPKLVDSETIFRDLLSWYQNEAKAYLANRTNVYAQKLGHFPASVRIKSYKARWGSCSVRGDIQYNWRLIMAPPQVIDYVVVHELCHLIEHNHSDRFWHLVSSLDETYQQHRQWLKQHGDMLDLHLVKT